MKVLGLDLSLSSTGYCIIDEDYNLIAYETIQTRAKDNTEEERLHIIGREIDRLIKEYNVTHIICEGSYKSVNVRTSQQLARLSGIAMYLAINNGIEIEACNPSSARKYTLGKGSAKKEEVFEWIKDNYWYMGEFSDKETKTIKKTSDLYDASLLCIFFLKKYKLDKKYGTNN